MEVGKFTAGEPVVIKATPASGEEDEALPYFAPRKLEEVQAKILEHKPAVVFAPHVETSIGMILPDDYLRGVAKACREVGAIFVLDCIASGNMWVDMKDTGVVRSWDRTENF